MSVVIKTNPKIRYEVGNSRRYAKRRFNALIDSYIKGGMTENFGENTIRKCLEYTHKQHLDTILSYSDYCDYVVKDIRATNEVIGDLLTPNHCYAIRQSYAERKNRGNDAKDYLDSIEFFDGLDVDKYDF